MLSMLHYDLLKDPLEPADVSKKAAAAAMASSQAEHMAYLKDRPYHQYPEEDLAKVMLL